MNKSKEIKRCPECGSALEHIPLGPGVSTDICFQCGYENKIDNRR